MIKKLTLFPVVMREEWLFRISVSDGENIMIVTTNTKDSSVFMVRFFVDKDDALAFIDEASEGKHYD